MSVPTVIVLIENEPVNEAVIFKQVDVIQEVNKIAYAQLIMIDGNPAKRSFQLSESEEFSPGSNVEIKLRYEGRTDSEDTVFKGVITSHSIDANRNGASLKIDMKDVAIKMTGSRNKAVYTEITDTDLFRTLIENNGLTVGELATTETEHEELIQYWCCDWDMLLNRADLYGFWVLTNNGEMNIINPSDIDTGTPDYNFEYGVDPIISFNLEANAEKQYGAIHANAWNIQDQEIAIGEDATDYNPNPGDLEPATLAEITGGNELQLNSSIPLPPDELTHWANGRMIKSRSALIKGTLSVPGNALIKPSQVIELSGLSSHFNGNTIISGVRHRVSALGWFTDIQFGIDPQPFASSKEIIDNPAGGLLPAVNGMQIGIVEEYEDDPQEELRIKVKLPALGSEDNTIWARLITPDAGDGRGYFFRPEPGDEVALGFLNNDPRHAVILGGFYSSAITPPVESDKISADNFIKGIYTKTGMKIDFDDENNTININTSDKQYIKINEKDKIIEIKDINDNSLVLDDSGITLTSGGDFSLEASGKVTIKGSEVDIQ